jgi:GntR family transcriptional repressor for pyruvate dehydrogenase complex
MNENVEVRFSRLERAPAFKTVSDAILKDIIGGRLRIGCRVKRSSPSSSASIREGIRLSEQTGVLRRDLGKRLVSAAHPMTALAIGSVRQ